MYINVNQHFPRNQAIVGIQSGNGGTMGEPLLRSAWGVMYVYVGVGVTAGVYLGWIDTEGFRMMGLQGVDGVVAVQLSCSGAKPFHDFLHFKGKFRVFQPWLQ